MSGREAPEPALPYPAHDTPAACRPLGHRRARAEHAAAADALVPGADEIWLRVVDIAAPAGAGSALLPRMAVSYTLTARGDTACRLVVRIAIDAPRAVPGPLGRAALAALRVGDLVMMRRRLLTLRALAERDARRAATGPRPG